MSKIFSNTIKHIRRSGWIGFGSVFVMTLSFFIMSVFAGFAYISDLTIKLFESQNNIVVFFEVGTDKEVINRLRDKWQEIPEVKNIQYVTEEQAYGRYVDYAARGLEDTYEVLIIKDEKKLPSTLDIELESLDNLDSVLEIIQADVEVERRLLQATDVDTDTEPTSAPNIISENDRSTIELNEEEPTVISVSENSRLKETKIEVGVNQESIDTQIEAYSYVRLAGIILIGLLFTVVFFLTFMTVEFRLYNQIEEIGVMQLVGGSLLFIRAPYILESGIYGLLGALLSSLAIILLYYLVFVAEVSASLSQVLIDNFSDLDWPELNEVSVSLLVLTVMGIGFMIGVISSYLSIRRYIR